MTAGPGVRFTLRVDASGQVAEARFETVALDEGRALANALCERLAGSSVAEACAFSLLDVARVAGRGPEDPVVRTVYYARSAALLPFLGRRAPGGPALTCVCFGVTTAALRTAIRVHGLRTVEEVQRHLPAATGCGTCRPDVAALLALERRP
jgi:bacterioferritin-associated ferredoxin